MNATPRIVRRAFGTVSLALAIIMLLAGQTVLEDRLRHAGFVVYWLGCFLFTILALVIAMADVRALRNESRNAQRDLLEKTFDNIERRNKSRN